MPLDLDNDLELRALLAPPPLRTAPTPARATIEVPVHLDHPERGCLTLEVRGFTVDEARQLRRPYEAASTALRKLKEHGAARSAELNPAGKADAAGEAYAEGMTGAEISPYQTKATLALLDAVREICRFGVVCYPAGELRRKGIEVAFALEEGEVGGRPKKGLCREALGVLEDALLTFPIAAAILLLSAGETPKSAAEQWEERAREREEAEAKKAGGEAAPTPRPFVSSTPSTPSS